MKELFSNLAWGAWLYGLGSGVIGGGASAVTTAVAAGVIDPKVFAVGGPACLKLMGASFVINGLLNGFFYLKQHPLPDKRSDTAVK